jgi:hypothetical protein
MRRWFVFVSAAAWLWTVDAGAQEKLVHKLEEGRKLVYLTETKTEQTLTLGGMDLETKSTGIQTTSHTLGKRADDGTLRQVEKVESVQVDLSLPGGLSFQFDSGNPNKAPDNPLLEPLAKMLRVTTQMATTLVFDRDNKLKDVELPADLVAQVDPMFQGMFNAEKLKKKLNGDRGYLPTEPVKPGDKWENNSEQGLGGGQTFFFRTEYEYTGVVEKDGRKLHRIVPRPLSVTYALDPPAGSPFNVTASDLKIADTEGEILFDAEQGAVQTHQNKLHITGDMTFNINGQELPGKLDLTIRSKVARQ